MMWKTTVKKICLCEVCPVKVKNIVNKKLSERHAGNDKVTSWPRIKQTNHLL